MLNGNVVSASSTKRERMARWEPLALLWAASGGGSGESHTIRGAAADVPSVEGSLTG